MGRREVRTAVASWARRREGVAAIAFLGAVLCLYLWPLLQGDQLGQSHILYGADPWKAYSPGTLPGRAGEGDVAFLFHPILTIAREQVRAAELPLWNPYSYAGNTLLGDMEAAVFYPLTWLAFVLPLEDAWGLMAALKLLTAGLGTFLLARHLRISRPGAAVSALVYMLCAPSIVWVQYSLGTVASLLPWLLLATDRLYREPGGRRVAELGTVVALSVLAGHPGTTWLTLSAAGLYLLALHLFDRRRSARSRRSARLLGQWLAAHALGAAASAVVLIPFLQAYLPSVTREVHGDLFAGTRLPVVTGLTYLLPDLFGDGKPDYFERHSNYELTAGYVGVLALLLGAVAVARYRRRTVVRSLGVMAGVALMAAYGLPPVTWILEILPPYSTVITAKNLFIVGLAAALAAGAGFCSLSRRPLAGRRIALLAGGTLAAALACVALASATGRLPAPADDEGAALLRFGVVLVLAGGCLAAVGRLKRAPALALVLVVAGLDLAYLQNYNVILPPDEAYPPRPGAVEFLQREDGTFRVSPISVLIFQPVLPPNTSALYGLESIQGYDFPLSERWANLSTKVLRERGNSPEHSYVSPRTDGASLVALRMMNTRYYVAAPGEDRPQAAFETVYRRRDATIFRDPAALPRAYVVPRTRPLDDRSALTVLVEGDLDPRREALVPADAPRPRIADPGRQGFREASVEQLSEQHIRIRVPRGASGWLVLANAYAPQWQAEIDGRPTELYPTNYAAMGLPIRAGADVVDVRYDRSGFWAGAGISAAALLVLALLAAGAGVRSRGASRRDG